MVRSPFFTALFVPVGGVEASGLLDVIGNAIGHTADDPSLRLFAALATIWVSAFLSALIDNIPFTVLGYSHRSGTPLD